MPREPASVRCRTIEPDDLVAVTDLLARGFPRRPRDYWARGFARQRELAADSALPAHGYVLDAGGRLVGVLLLTHAPACAGALRRCNLSSWYVEPAHRGQASLLVFAALRRKDVTYTNVSAAPRTWPIIEAQGFRRYAAGLFLAAPWLAPFRRGMAVSVFEAASAEGLTPDERDILSSHAGFGCLSVVVRSPEGALPFVFLPLRMRGGRVPLPGVQLIYCRDVADVARCAGPLGRYLLGRGAPLVAIDANGPLPGLAGLYAPGRKPRFAKGPSPPRPGDLAFTELAVFGA